MAKKVRVYVYEPVGLDLWDAKPHGPKRGDRVVVTQPYGTPRNGTMGMTYVNDAESGEFRGLVLKKSLKATNDYVVSRDLAAEARDARSAALRGR